MYVAVCASLALSACAQRHWKLLRHLVKPGTHCDIDFVWHSDFASASASSSRMTNACTPVCCRICVHHTIVTCTPDRCIPIKWWMRHPQANFVSLSPSLDLGWATNFPLVKWRKLLRSRIAELKLENFHSIFIRGALTRHLSIYMSRASLSCDRIRRTSIRCFDSTRFAINDAIYRLYCYHHLVNGNGIERQLNDATVQPLNPKIPRSQDIANDIDSASSTVSLWYIRNQFRPNGKDHSINLGKWTRERAAERKETFICSPFACWSCACLESQTG